MNSKEESQTLTSLQMKTNDMRLNLSCQLAGTLEHLGFYAEAEEAYESCLLLAEEHRDKQLTVWKLTTSLARICKLRNKPVESALLCDRAERILDGDSTEPLKPVGGSSGFYKLLGDF